MEAAVTSESSSQTGGKGRQKHKCPYPSCSAKVVHLPGHMRQKHKWDEGDAVGVLKMFGLRAERKRTSTKCKRVHKKRMCPIDGCRSVVKRIHNHLTDVHNKKRGSKEYKYWLKMAVIYQGKDISELQSLLQIQARQKMGKKPPVGENMQKLINLKNVESFINKFTAAMRKVLEMNTLASFKIKQLNKRHWLIHLCSSLKKIQVVAINLRALVMKLWYQTLMVSLLMMTMMAMMI